MFAIVTFSMRWTMSGVKLVICVVLFKTELQSHDESGRGLNLIELSVRSVTADLPCLICSHLMSTSSFRCQ